MEQILIIGGNAAGLAAASRAKRIDPRLNVTVLEKGPHISYSTCGIPYYLAKMVSAADLIAYTPESFEKERGIKVHNYTRVDEISPSRKPFIYTNASRMSCPEWMPIWRRLSNMNSSGSASGFPLARMCWPWPASKATSPVSKRQVDWESIRRRWYFWTLELYRM